MVLVRKLLYLLRRRRWEAELREEMDFHREMSGARAFGNATLAREDARGVWISRWIDEAWQDGRHTTRAMMRQPGFAAAVIAIVALGGGAATSVFGLLDALVLRSLPVERPERLVYFSSPAFSYPIFQEVEKRMPVFAGVFGWNIDRAYVDWNGGARELMPADVLETTGGFFTTLRVSAAAGRTFDATDSTAAVISHAAWKRHFAMDPSAIGRSIRVGDASFTIVGVAPASFYGVAPGLDPEVVVPIAGRYGPGSSVFTSTTSSWLHLMARLEDDVTLARAQAALQTVWPAVLAATTNPGAPPDRRTLYLGRQTSLESARAGYSRVRNQFGDPLRVLMGLMVLLLAIACASVANLLLARGIARGKEMAVRLAIGAGRGRLVRQLVVESLVLTLAGSAIGLLLATWSSAGLVGFLSTSRDHFALDTAPGWRTTSFAVALAVAIAVLSAALPAFVAVRGAVTSGLKDGQARASILRRWSPGKILVGLQVALALVLLAGAAVFGRSLSVVLAQDTGIDADRVAVVAIDSSALGYKGAAQRALDLRLLDRLAAIPGVESAAMSWLPPISTTMGNWTQNVLVDGAPPAGETAQVFFNGITPTFFATVGMHLRRGRSILETDSGGAPKVAVINESLARRYFPGSDPIGHRITIGKAASRKDLEIVGVVQDAKYRTLQEPARAIAYLAVAQVEDVTNGRDLFAELRASKVSSAAAAARLAVRDLDPRLPVHVETMHDRIAESIQTERVIGALAAVLGVVALALACAGLYGLLGYAVARHGREIGLRMALGAPPSSVVWMVQRESLALATLGVAAGLAGALALGRFVRTLLFEVSADDPVALGAATVVMLGVAAAAAYIPARRAAHVDPLVALRSE